MNSKKTATVIMQSLAAIAILVFVFPSIFRGIINKASQNTMDRPQTVSMIRHDVPAATGRAVLEQSPDPNHLFGYIRSIREDEGILYAEFDLAEWITNDHSPTSTPESAMQADLAAAEDGNCGYTPEEATPGSCAPNGFYIRNNSTSTRMIPINSDVIIESYRSAHSTSGLYLNEDGTWKLTRISIDELKRIIETINSNFGPVFDVSVRDGKIWKIAEKYIP
jgi:hypothetical protein